MQTSLYPITDLRLVEVTQEQSHVSGEQFDVLDVPDGLEGPEHADVTHLTVHAHGHVDLQVLHAGLAQTAPLLGLVQRLRHRPRVLVAAHQGRWGHREQMGLDLAYR